MAISSCFCFPPILKESFGLLLCADFVGLCWCSDALLMPLGAVSSLSRHFLDTRQVCGPRLGVCDPPRLVFHLWSLSGEHVWECGFLSL